MTEPTLPGLAAVPPVRDELDRRYTPQSLADAIVDRLNITPRRVLEPSVGGGAFVRAVSRRWPTIRIDGVDLDPHAPGLMMCDRVYCGDFLAWEGSHDLIIGNPPFSEALEHVRHALTFGCPVVFVLPLAYLGVQQWTPLLQDFVPDVVRPIVGRPWPEHVRECAVFEWRTKHGSVGTRMELLDGWQR
jgi:hypothetical protein